MTDTPVTLKQGQGHQTRYESVDPTKCYNNAKFQKPHLSSLPERANDKSFWVFFKSGK